MKAALELFSEHGVSATSLQMIANALGVTKAAVYHQFNTKDEIVLAVTEAEMLKIEAALDAAEAEHDRLRAREMLLVWVIDLAIQRRRLVSVLQFDPVIIRLLASHEPFVAVINRLYGVLMGDDAGPKSLVQAAMLSAAIGGTVANPLVDGLDEQTLREQLIFLTRRIVGIA
ncbi:MAG: helix-turn-helix domain-containing protein [Mycobacterium sp.]|uniref:TetR/AcrR family transcriptional regulator n=1 Tax=Mycobacterium sp. TaxID=1785 RepID=UPI003CC68418